MKRIIGVIFTGQLLLGMEFGLECGLYTQWTPLVKTEFSFLSASGYQWQIASWLGVQALSTLSPLSARTLSGLKLCRT